MAKPTIFTINGWRGDMWAGPQADVGRYLSDRGLNVAYWQPIGYVNNEFPLSRGVDNGLAELRHQLDLHRGPFLFSSWSLGSIIAVEWYKQARAGGPQADRVGDLRGSTTFGNPYRQRGKWAPRAGYGAVGDPGGEGIGGVANNLTDTPGWWHDYAHPGDMYTCCPDGEIGENIRLVFDFVLAQWNGAWWDLWHEAQEWVTGALLQFPPLLWAIIKAITFYGGGTADHMNYDARVTGAMNYMAGIARSVA